MSGNLLRSREILIEQLEVIKGRKLTEIKLQILEETSLSQFRVAYESMMLSAGGNKNICQVSEKFTVLKHRKESMLKVVLSAKESLGHRFSLEGFFFFEDLLKDNRSVKLENENYGFVFQMRVMNESQPAHVLEEEYKAGMAPLLDLYDWVVTLQKFLSELTPVRRMLVDFFNFVQREDLLRDLKIVALILVIIWFPFECVCILMILTFLFDLRFSLRFKVLRFFKDYFEKKEDLIDMQKANINFSLVQLKMLIELIKLVKEVLHSDNKFFFFYIFVYRFYLKGILLLIALCIPMKFLLSGMIFGLFGFKHWQLFLQKLHFAGILADFNTCRNSLRKLVHDISEFWAQQYPKVITKSVLCIEVQKKKLGKWTEHRTSQQPTNMDDSILQEWKWISPWKYELIANCDADGWSYYTKVNGILQQRNQENTKYRKRVWKKVCEKVL